MRVLVASHPSGLEHDTGPHHPERPDRVRAVDRGVAGSGLEVIRLEAPAIRRSELALVHEASYIEMVEAFCSLGGGALDMDTVVSEASWEAALHAAGGVRALVEELRVTNDATGFAISRPPGHHALADRAMGFCLFNNVAVTAALLRSSGERVAILDWDVHHGNGTQALVGHDAGVLYVSAHQAPFYPFDGSIDDIDTEDGKGTVVNIPLPAGTRGDVYRRAWGELVIPVVEQFEPDWVLISAGFDAHESDPLADLELTSADYGWLAASLTSVHPAQRTIAVLEGGYDLVAMEESAAMTVMGLAGVSSPADPTGFSPDRSRLAFDRAAAAVSRHWRI